MVASSSGFNLICNQVAGLQRVPHASGPHANTVADSDSTELVANETSLYQRGFGFLPETKKMFVASGPMYENLFQ